MLLKGKTSSSRDGCRSGPTDRDKRNRYTPEVSADRVVLLGSPGGQRTGTSRESHPVDELGQAPGDINADDIPF